MVVQTSLHLSLGLSVMTPRKPVGSVTAEMATIAPDDVVVTFHLRATDGVYAPVTHVEAPVEATSAEELSTSPDVASYGHAVLVVHEDGSATRSDEVDGVL